MKIYHRFLDRNIPGSTHQYLGSDVTVIETNRLALQRHLEVTDLKICILNQIHSDVVIKIPENTSKIESPEEHNNYWHLGLEPKADSMATNMPNLMLAIMTADCVPLILIDKHNSVIAAVHSGWKGAKSALIANTITEMQSLGAETKHIEAYIGPCIHQDSYEVSGDFRDLFLQENLSNNIFFQNLKSDKFLFDLPSYVKNKLISYNVTHIQQQNTDTYNASSLFSYRRHCKTGENCGRNLSVVYMQR